MWILKLQTKNLPFSPCFWSNYSDLTRPHPKWWFSKGNPLISGKSRLVKYYNLPRCFRQWGVSIFCLIDSCPCCLLQIELSQRWRDQPFFLAHTFLRAKRKKKRSDADFPFWAAKGKRTVHEKVECWCFVVWKMYIYIYLSWWTWKVWKGFCKQTLCFF